jgi:hypothetical protein
MCPAKTAPFADLRVLVHAAEVWRYTTLVQPYSTQMSQILYCTMLSAKTTVLRFNVYPCILIIGYIAEITEFNQKVTNSLQFVPAWFALSGKERRLNVV